MTSSVDAMRELVEAIIKKVMEIDHEKNCMEQQAGIVVFEYLE